VTLLWSVAILAAALARTPEVTEADVPRARPEPRQVQGATHVVMGLVTGVYSAETPAALDVREKGTMYLIEIVVERLEKGEGPRVDELVYVRCEKRNQTTIPRPHQRVRAYMKRDRDGGYDLLAPDGIDVFAATKH
jgi:hypothetical protein